MVLYRNRAAAAGHAGGDAFVLDHGRLAFKGRYAVLHGDSEPVAGYFRLGQFGANSGQDLAVGRVGQRI